MTTSNNGKLFISVLVYKITPGNKYNTMIIIKKLFFILRCPFINSFFATLFTKIELNFFRDYIYIYISLEIGVQYHAESYQKLKK